MAETDAQMGSFRGTHTERPRGPLSSFLVDKYGCRVTIAIGGLVSFGSLMMSSFATSVYFILVTLGVLTGSGFGISYLAATVAVSQFFVKYRAMAMGIAVSGSAFGTLVFPMMNRYLIDTYSWRGALLINAAIQLHVVMAALLIPRVPPLKFDSSIDEDNNQLSKETWKNDCASFSKNIGYILFCLNNFIYCIGLFVVYTNMASYARSVGFSKSFGSMLLSVLGLASLLGRLSLSAVTQLGVVSAPTLCSIAFTITGLGTIISGFWNSGAGMITTSFSFGFFSCAFGALTPETTIYVVGVKDLNRAMGITMLVAAIGILLGPPIAGFIFDRTRFYSASFYFGGVCMVVSALVLAPVGMKMKWRERNLTEETVKVQIE